MADPRVFELDELLVRPGAYFNPQTEVLVVVDDSPELDTEIFNMEEFEGADWVLVSDESPVDEHRRDELLERFQVHYHPGGAGVDHRRRRRARRRARGQEAAAEAGATRSVRALGAELARPWRAPFFAAACGALRGLRRRRRRCHASTT